mmetsp:Transcript_4952/g.14386  ORF Transcript_4952/g.14386 Transcript_4952/m.14386 type:complete len:215 (-) Transcript_4952:1999-2643(-)
MIMIVAAPCKPRRNRLGPPPQDHASLSSRACVSVGRQFQVPRTEPNQTIPCPTVREHLAQREMPPEASQREDATDESDDDAASGRHGTAVESSLPEQLEPVELVASLPLEPPLWRDPRTSSADAGPETAARFACCSNEACLPAAPLPAPKRGLPSEAAETAQPDAAVFRRDGRFACLMRHLSGFDLKPILCSLVARSRVMLLCFFFWNNRRFLR